jgi:hypothetical protein
MPKQITHVGFEVFTAVMKSSKLATWFLLNLLLRPWRWRRYVPPKRRLKLNGLHGVISQKMMTLFEFLMSLPHYTSTNSIWNPAGIFATLTLSWPYPHTRFILKTATEFLLKALDFVSVIESVELSVLRIGKCVILRDSTCSSQSRSFLSNAVILSNIHLTRWFNPSRLMFSSFICWVIPMQNAKSHIQSCSPKCGKCFPFITRNI